MFRLICWNYNKLFLNAEDYKLVARPKKVAAALGSVWALVFYGLQQVYTNNPEKFYQKFLFTPFAPVFLFACPVCIVYGYFKIQNGIYASMYTKYVGKLTDE